MSGSSKSGTEDAPASEYSPERGRHEVTGVENRRLTFFGLWNNRKTKNPPGLYNPEGFQKTAAAYSPNWCVSTIGDGELNCSVRNGKRWILTAIATAIFYLRENNSVLKIITHLSLFA